MTTATLVQTIDTSAFAPASPDPAGITYVNTLNRLLLTDSEVNEIPALFVGDNLFEITLLGDLIETDSTLSFSSEPTGISYNPLNGHYFLADDDRDRIFEVDSQFQLINEFDTRLFNSFDPEGITYAEDLGTLFIVDGADGAGSTVYQVTTDGTLISSFATASLGVNDAEGIAYNPINGHLYLVGVPSNTVAEVTTDGTLVQLIDISSANPVRPAGLTFGPGSEDPNETALYIVDRGIDNNADPTENDGKIYEFSISDLNPVADDSFLFSLISDRTLGGRTYTEQDVVQFDGTGFSVLFDGSDVGLPNSNEYEINALDLISPNQLLLSFDEGGLFLPGLGIVDDSDVVLFTATSLGENTAGSFSLYFDGSDVGLTSDSEDIDAITSLPDGTLLLSTTGNVNVPGVSRADEDILQFTPTSLGTNTAGTFSVFVDGSDIGLTNSSEDVDAFSIDATGDFYFSTTGSFSISGVSGTDDDVFAFTPSSTGIITRGSFDSNLFFDASQFGLSDDIKGLDLTFSGTGGNPGTPIRFEAGEADTIVNFRFEAISAASGGGVYSLAGGSTNESGSLTFGFNEAPGTYDVIVGTFDENDGVTQFNVELNDTETGITTEIGNLQLDANLGSNLPNAQTIIAPTVAFGVDLTPGDSITVNGFEDGFEFARVDYLELVPV